MAVDDRFFISLPLDQFIIDKDTALPLSGGTLEFYKDSSRAEPKPVFQLTGAPPNYTYVAFPNPITLSAVGTIQNGTDDNELIYLLPFDDDGAVELYYIKCFSKTGVLQWERQAFPNINSGSSAESDLIFSNQVANPQFTKTFLNKDQTDILSFSAATEQAVPIGPDWDMVVSGTGTVGVKKVALSGNENIINSPPFVLDVNVSAGITECILRQRLAINPGLWASTEDNDIFLSGAITVRNELAGDTSIDYFYRASNSAVEESIINETFDNSDYVELRGATINPIPPSTDTASGDAAFVDINVRIQPASNIRVTSLQVIPSANPVIANTIQYDTKSSNREQAMMGDYFIPELSNREQENILVGWDFGVNPAQRGTGFVVDGTAKYTWDQTISSSTGGTFQLDRVSTSDRKVMTIRSDSATSAIFLSQYLINRDTEKLRQGKLCVNISAYVKSVSDAVTCRVYLFRAPSTEALPVLPAFIGTMDAAGVFTKGVNGFVEIGRSGLPTAQGVLGTDPVNVKDLKFSGWKLETEDEINNSERFCIVVTFETPDASTEIILDSINLTNGDLPSRPTTKTQNQTLYECQRYYEQSYPTGTAPGTASNFKDMIHTPVRSSNTVTFSGGNRQVHVGGNNFTIEFKSEKLLAPQVNLFDDTGTIDTVGASANFYNDGLAAKGFTNNDGETAQVLAAAASKSSNKDAFFLIFDWPKPPGNFVSGSVLVQGVGVVPVNDVLTFATYYYHYVADSRLGQF